MNDSLTVLLVDDHALFRAGLVVLLGKMDEVGRVVEKGSGAEALAFVEAESDIDLVILDYGLQDTDGISVLQKMKQLQPALPIVLLSAHVDSALIQHCLREHASGFIPKTSTPDVMVSAVQLVMNGGIYVPPEAIGNNQAADHSFSSYERKHGASSKIQLTQRQMDVLLHMKNGLSNKEIARELSMSPSTVKVHVAAILREFDASSRTQAVFLAKDQGLLD